MKNKKLIPITISAVIISLLLTACQKSEEPDIKPETPVFDFENGTRSGFFPRAGTETLTVVQGAGYSGEFSLLVTDRSETWHGAEVRIDEYIDGDTEYLITAWVYLITPIPTDISLCTQIGEGDAARVITIDSKNGVSAGQWVELKGEYYYGGDSDKYISLFIENGEYDGQYYIDDVSVVKADTGNNLDLSLPSLTETYKDYFMFGSAFVSDDLSGIRFALIKHHFDVMTAGNDMKPDAMQSSKGWFSFTKMDEMEQILSNENILLCGHTLAWHNQSPSWLNKDADGNPLTREQAAQNLVEHVQGVAGHYAGRVIVWDVLNEAMADGAGNPSDWRSSLRKSEWYQAFENGADAEKGESGADYIYLLFKEARKADPNAVLYYNDYNLDYQNKAEAVAAMVTELNEMYAAEGNDRLLIEGVGMQSHFNMGTKPEDVERSIQLFIGLGVEVSVTELDITVDGAKNSDALTEEQELRQANLYAQLMVLYKKYSDNIARVTVWGLDDATSWRSDRFPLLFNSDLSAKYAYYAVIDPEGFLNDPEGTVERLNANGG